MDAVDETIQSFFAAYPRHVVPSGHIVASPDSPLVDISYVYSGWIEQYDVSEQGNKLVVNTYGPGSYVPMSLLFGQGSGIWFYETLDDCVLFTAPVSDVSDFVRSHSDVLYSYASRLCSGASGQQRRMAHLMGGSAATRLLYEIIVMFRRYGEKNDGVVTIDCTDAKLANASGLSRETVSREIAILKQAGYVDRRYKNISTKSLSRLEKKLGFKV